VEYTNFSEQSHSQLASGELDVGLGFIPPLDSGFHRQKLFTERFVAVVRKGHTRIKRRLTLEDFERESRLIVTTSATGHNFLEKTYYEYRSPGDGSGTVCEGDGRACRRADLFPANEGAFLRGAAVLARAVPQNEATSRLQLLS
jgi:DNA-binding transcriptional LysR family regulator